MTTQNSKTDWEKIREILLANGFVVCQDGESDICMKKDKSEVRIPKVTILPPVFIKYLVLASGISQEKFV